MCLKFHSFEVLEVSTLEMQLPLNVGFVPKMWHETVWRTQSSSIWVQKGAFCGLQNTPKCVSGRGFVRTPMGELTTLPRPPVGWGASWAHPSGVQGEASAENAFLLFLAGHRTLLSHMRMHRVRQTMCLVTLGARQRLWGWGVSCPCPNV